MNDISDAESDDLIRLVTSNADISSQYVIFQNGKGEYFVINVAKVEELIVYKDMYKVDTTDIYGLVEGTAKVREHMMSIVNLDRWLGIDELPKDEYELAMICNYAGTRVAMVIKSVYGVVNIEPSQMYDDSNKDEKISYLTELVIEGEKLLAKVFNSDLFIHDVMPDKYEKEMAKADGFADSKDLIKKRVLLAEDSHLMQEAIERLLENMDINYAAYDNGKLLYDSLEKEDLDDIGLIITDIEMPVMGGLELIKLCKESELYKDIPIVVNTNMSNAGIVNSADKLGAKEVLKKLDLDALRDVLVKYAGE